MTHMEEIWKDVVNGHGVYEVSNLGNIRAKTREIWHFNNGSYIKRVYKGKPISKVNVGGGYKAICIHWKGTRRMEKVHRMVAEAFLPNPQNLPQVNHKDGDKTNNCVDNLEWCTAQQNVKHTFDCLGREPCNKKPCICHNDGKRYASLTDAAKAYNIHPSQVKDVCKRKILHAKKLTFSYI